MSTKEFLSLLQDNPEKSLLFEYKHGHFVGANYHITEVKNITIDAVDCGANTDFWKETIVQLWESPLEKDKKEYMTTNKALDILNKVDRMKPMEREVEMKFEYSTPADHTSLLFVFAYTIDSIQLMMQLGVVQTVCTA